MTQSSPRLLIVDQSLRDTAGHHYEYDLALVRAALALGLTAVVGAHKDVRALEFSGATLRGWFSTAWFDSTSDAASRKAVDILSRLPGTLRRPAMRMGLLARRAVRHFSNDRLLSRASTSHFADELLELVRSERFGNADHVLIHTLSIPELEGLVDALHTPQHLPTFHILLRRDAEEPGVAATARGGVRETFVRISQLPPGKAARFRFYTDTDELAAQYGALASGTKFDVLPIPHCLPAAETRGDATARPLQIVYAGDARREKGFHLLPALVDALAGGILPHRARFIIQANSGVRESDPEIAAARHRLAAYPKNQVELREQRLSLAGFHHLILGADIILLPYEHAAYRRRSSGVLVQALIAGCPVVVPRDTWLARQVDPAASMLFDDPAGLVVAVRNAVDEWPILRGKALAQAAAWRARHDASTFIGRLLQP
jgi:hypothetical protein